MIATVTPLRPIKMLEGAEKARLPVSVAHAQDGTEIVVSRYEDEEWDFWPYIRQENRKAGDKRIDWRVKLPDGSRLTDPQHAALLESAKDFLWSLFSEPVEGRGRPTMTTVQRKLRDMRPLLRWMVGQGMTRFGQLDGRTLDYVPVAKRGENGRAVAGTTASLNLAILEDLYAQRAKLNDALTRHPWPHESATGLAGRDQRGGRKPKTRRIPEAVVQPLAAKALDYVQNQAKGLLDARDALEAVRVAAEAEGVKPSTISDRVSQAARERGYACKREHSSEITRLRTACYIVIDLFSGVRDSEMLALGRHCVSHATGPDGVDLTWIHGPIYKTDDPVHKWLVPPVVETAVRVMERYSEPFRALLLAEGKTIGRRLADGGVGAAERGRLAKRLDVVRSQQDKLFLSRSKAKGTIQVVSGSTMGVQLKAFCREFDILGEDGKAWPLAAHQFRRTYAYFVASAELGDLQVLREHFGHWSLDMTLLYADGATDGYEVDSDLLGEILAAKNERQEGVLRNYLLDDALLANGDVMLGDLRRTVRTAKNKDELIRQVSEGIVLNGTGHSWCIGNAKGSGCGGRCVFEADMCVDCNYGMIGPEHLPVWREIVEQQAAALEAPDLGLPGKARAKRILDKAREVVSKLEGAA